MSLAEKDVFVNINAMSADSYSGWMMTGLSCRNYGDSIHLYDAPDGHSYSFFQGGNVKSDGGRDSDFFAVEQGCVSISRVHAQPVSADYKTGDNLKLIL